MIRTVHRNEGIVTSSGPPDDTSGGLNGAITLAPRADGSGSEEHPAANMPRCFSWGRTLKEIHVKSSGLKSYRYDGPVSLQHICTYVCIYIYTYTWYMSHMQIYIYMYTYVYMYTYM